MTREEILKADEDMLQERWVELMYNPKTYRPDQNEANKEYLMIGIRLKLMRKQYKEAAEFSEELMKRYGESLKED